VMMATMPRASSNSTARTYRRNVLAIVGYPVAATAQLRMSIRR